MSKERKWKPITQWTTLARTLDLIGFKKSICLHEKLKLKKNEFVSLYFDRDKYKVIVRKSNGRSDNHWIASEAMLYTSAYFNLLEKMSNKN